MGRELTDGEAVAMLRRALSMERKDRQTWVWLDDGSMLEIGPSWRGQCRMMFYTPDEANRMSL